MCKLKFYLPTNLGLAEMSFLTSMVKESMKANFFCRLKLISVFQIFQKLSHRTFSKTKIHKSISIFQKERKKIIYFTSYFFYHVHKFSNFMSIKQLKCQFKIYQITEVDRNRNTKNKNMRNRPTCKKDILKKFPCCVVICPTRSNPTFFPQMGHT